MQNIAELYKKTKRRERWSSSDNIRPVSGVDVIL